MTKFIQAIIYPNTKNTVHSSQSVRSPAVLDLPTSRAQGFFVFRKREKPQKIERGARTSGSTRAHHRNRKWEAKDFWESLTD